MREADKREGLCTDLQCVAKKKCRVFGDSYSQLHLVVVVRYYKPRKRRDVPDLLKRRDWLAWTTGVRTDLSVCREADEIIGRKGRRTGRALLGL